MYVYDDLRFSIRKRQETNTKHEKCPTCKELNLCLVRLSSFYQSKTFFVCVCVCVVVVVVVAAAAAAVLGFEGWVARARTRGRVTVGGGVRTRYLGITIFKQLHY